MAIKHHNLRAFLCISTLLRCDSSIPARQSSSLANSSHSAICSSICRDNALQETQHHLHARQILLHLKVMHLHFGRIFHARIFLLISSPICFGKACDVLLFHRYCSDFAVILSSIISTLISKKFLKLMILH